MARRRGRGSRGGRSGIRPLVGSSENRAQTGEQLVVQGDRIVMVDTFLGGRGPIVDEPDLKPKSKQTIRFEREQAEARLAELRRRKAGVASTARAAAPAQPAPTPAPVSAPQPPRAKPAPTPAPARAAPPHQQSSPKPQMVQFASFALPAEVVAPLQRRARELGITDAKFIIRLLSEEAARLRSSGL
jgi:hypothetical protein